MARVGLECGERRKCDACGMPIIGAMTEAGKIMPVVLHPDPALGNLLLYRTPDGYPHCRVVPPAVKGWANEVGVPLRRSHFSDCPNADKFRTA